MADPMHQFEVQRVVTLPEVTIPGVGPIDLSITNSTLSMFIAAGLITLFLAAVTARPAVVPGRTQTVGELLFGLIDDLAHSIMGHAGRAYFPFVFTLFLFILFMNLLVTAAAATACGPPPLRPGRRRA